MFSMFPDGSPGAGLLLLRAAGGAVLITQGAAYLRDKNESGFLALIVVSVTCVVGLLLLIGFLTRMAALVAAVIGVDNLLSWFPKVHAAPPLTPTTALFFALIAISPIFLGAAA